MIPLLSSIPFLVHFSLSVLAAVRLLYRKLAVNTTLVWLFLLFGLPVVGVVLYILFGDHRLGRQRMQMSERLRSFFMQVFSIDAASIPPDIARIPRYAALSRSIQADTGFPVLTGLSPSFYADAGDLYAAMQADIDAASDSIFLEFYILDPAGRVADVLAAVERAALRGVDCKILADDFGSKALFRTHWPKRLRKAGVRIVRSLRVNLFSSFFRRSDLRNHRKILVCDQHVGYVGSYNLADPKLFKADRGVGEWVDMMMRVEGPVVDALKSVCLSDYLFDSVGHQIGRADLNALTIKRRDETAASLDAGTPVSMQVLPSGPEMRNSTIYEVLVSAIFSAQRRLRIVSPYFIPDPAVQLALVSAAKRGIEVEIIVPERLDSRLAQFASQSSYRELLRAGVRLIRYRGGLLHTKLVLVDDEIALFGTLNIDVRSFHLNLELTMVIYDAATSATLWQHSDAYLANSTPLDLDGWEQRPEWHKFLENILRLASPIL
ncbi:cardiolipin synthase [Hyphomonas sp.]|jgi:cardiolipin synthase|uniref:cardiolipin synthase n=1 Tax=Hyphomonas sp. TaxID=87 RepID=UPI003242065E